MADEQAKATELTEKVLKENLDEMMLQQNLGKIAYTLDKAYLAELDNYGVLLFDEYCRNRNIQYEVNKTRNFMALKIDKFIINKDEKVIDCMKNIIGTFSNTVDSLSFLIRRRKDYVSLYFIFKKDADINPEYVKNRVMLLKSAIEGNFAGSSVTGIQFDYYDEDVPASKLNNTDEFGFLDEASSIAVLTSVPSDKSRDYICQGIEKLLNGVVPTSNDKEYSIMMLAQSMTQEEIREVISGFEDMASAISPYSAHQFQAGTNDSESTGEMKSSTDTEGVSHAITKTHSINVGLNVGGSRGRTIGENNSEAYSESDTNSETQSHTDGVYSTDTTTTTSGSQTAPETKTESVSKTRSGAGIGGGAGTVIGAAIGSVIPGAGTVVGGLIGGGIGSLVGGLIGSKTKSTGTTTTTSPGYSSSTSTTTSAMKSAADTIAKTAAHTVGKTLTSGAFSAVTKMLNLGLSGGYGYSWGKIDTTSTSKALTDGTNHNVTTGTSENSIYNYKSYRVSDLVQNLEATIKRLTESKATGLWKTAVYVFSSDSNTSKSVANYLRGLTQGDESYIEAPIVYEWKQSSTDDLFQEVKKYLTHFIHPIFINGNDMRYNNISKDEIISGAEEALRESGIDDETIADEIRKNVNAFNGVELIPITTTTNISTTELAKLFALPTHSLPGLPVLECAEFGRTVSSYDSNRNVDYPINLGSIYHMHRAEKLPVLLNTDSLCSHTFITGSTGSGKSNTIYQMLCGIRKLGKKFMVIEPAKGEYKNVFGNDHNVSVYGTNPRLTELLCINPFSFDNKHIHILEHLDRLIEIFNVCWPMYAAMPAVLKEAVEKSYEDAGWNLTASENKYGDNFYPTFADVTRNVRQIIDNSDYDVLNKGSYKGALVTRLKSLTNGINGLIFTTDELSPQELFDENVIVDLSRVGSTETKALMMGLLVLKLQEYRMSQGGMNNELQHVTVLEEAHNLLKATSTEQHEDSGNLLGKSVEMLTNAIAEMRTYGEGFIIADQAPGLLDKAVIRNTNTKIIMRLPDLADRELVGKAANLNDHQIEELAKLPCGVAAVYQNEWVQPVLCQVDKYNGAELNYEYKPQENKPIKDIPDRIAVAQLLSCDESMDEKTKLNDIKDILSKIYIHDTAKVMIMRYLTETSPKPKFVKLAPIMAELFPKSYDAMIQSYQNDKVDNSHWSTDIAVALDEEINNAEIERTLKNDIIQAIVTQYIHNELNQPEIYKNWVQDIKNKGGLLI